MDILYKIFVEPFALMGSAPDLLVQTGWEGFVAGVLYALIALGFVLIFKASGVFNFAQGIMVVFAALSLVGIYELLTTRLGLPPGLVAALVALVGALAVMFVLAGFMSILMGVQAELVMRTYYESQAKATYVLRDLRGLPGIVRG